jgi:hypothetical protein
MALSDLSSAQLERLVQLLKEKESLQSNLVQVERSLEALEGDGTAKDKSLAKKRGPRRGHRRAALKDALLAKLQAAGKQGLTVKELAAGLNAKPASVSVWFCTTGKQFLKSGELKKVAPATFAYFKPAKAS